jgi:hypothetical protein
MGYRGTSRVVKVQTEDRCPQQTGENMLCDTLATVRNGKIPNEAIYRSLLGYFRPIFMDIQASPPHLQRTHFSKRLSMSIGTKIYERTQALATPNANLTCIFTHIDPFPPLRQVADPKPMDHPTLIAGQPVATAEPRAVQLSYGGCEIKEARLEIDRSRGQVGNPPHTHTSVVLESVPHIPPAVKYPATASALWVKL